MANTFSDLCLNLSSIPLQFEFNKLQAGIDYPPTATVTEDMIHINIYWIQSK